MYKRQDDDKDNGPKTYVLNLPSYETHTLDLGDVENPVDTWSSSYEDQGTTYTTNYFQTLLTDNSKIFEFDCISSDSYGFGSDGFAFTNCCLLYTSASRHSRKQLEIMDLLSLLSCKRQINSLSLSRIGLQLSCTRGAIKRESGASPEQSRCCKFVYYVVSNDF